MVSPQTRRSRQPAPDTMHPARRFLSVPFAGGLAGSLLLWAAFPPLGLSLLAWIAPVFWLKLIDRESLSGRKPYGQIWLAAFVHWLLLLWGIQFAHPILYLGWLALSAYLACYLPLFVSVSRVAVHQLRIPLAIAAPALWVGLELARAWLLTGFAMGLLGHTQVEFPLLIQVANLGGAYCVSFVVLAVASCLTRCLPDGRGGGWRPSHAVYAATLLLLVLVYGHLQLSREPGTDPRELRVALLQGSVDTVFEYNPARNDATFASYMDQARAARDADPELDLIVWPESVYSGNLRELKRGGELRAPPGSGMSDAEFRETIQSWAEAFDHKVQLTAAAVNERADGTKLQVFNLVGTETELLNADGAGNSRHYNTALLINPDGAIAARYYKTHLVMIGEYIPLGDWFPIIYRLSPMKQGLSSGDGPAVFQVGDLRLSPGVCFESTVPHLIRGQVAELERAGTPPDALVNVTNDGWFWGAAILDLHMTCAVFRAVENRLPMLVAANTGISTFVDSRGRIQARSPRREDDIILARIRPGMRNTWYQAVGDWPAGIGLLFTGVMAVIGWCGRRQRSAGQSDQGEGVPPA